MKTTSKLKPLPKYIVGLDLGDKKHALHVVDRRGEVIEERDIVNTKEALRRLSRKYTKARIAMEVGLQSPWISRLLQFEGHEVFVANARKLPVIYTNGRKSDRKDAQMLAKLARVDPELLHPIEHGSEQAQRDLLQIRLRDNLVRQRVNVISSVRFTLKSLGVRIPSPNTNCFAKKARHELTAIDEELLAMVEPSLRAIDTLTVQIHELDKAIERLAQESYPETDRLLQIRGVGSITPLTFILTVGDPERFASNRDVGPWLGLVPKRDQIGGLDKQLRISKAGDAYLRRLLVGAAQYILGPFGEDCDLQRHGLELAERGGQGAKKKAVVATARKLAVLMLALWREESTYKPVLAANS